MEQKQESVLWIEERQERGTFNPFVHPSLTRFLSLIAPHLYTQHELAIIDELHNNLTSNTDDHLSLQTMMPLPWKNKKTHMLNSRKRSRYSSDHEASTSKNERRIKPKKNEPTPSSPPELPIHVRNIIKNLNGTDIKFVMCKKLFNTDLNPYNNRLSLPLREIKSDFLTEREKKILDSKNDDGKPLGLEVTVLDPCFKEYTMDFKKWQMQTSSVYNLVRNWRVLLSDNNMQKGNELNVWSFRVNGKLYFTLNNKED